jgi:2-aminoethylphosphonate-pyruvate transaminase
MLHDYGSRDAVFMKAVAEIRASLLEVGGTSAEGGYECVIMQGAGTFGLESVMGSVVPRNSAEAVLVLVNGAYGKRMCQMLEVLGIEHEALTFAENEPVNPAAVERTLAYNPRLKWVTLVHCETTTGILNPVAEIGKVVQQQQRVFILDSMSAFGGIPFSLPESGVHFLISSSNKCIEGVPGFSFVLAERKALEGCKGHARSLSLDLYAQWQSLQTTGQFRFTPPVHTLMAFRQALQLLAAEGGVAARHQRYATNQQLLHQGMTQLGFESYLPAHLQAPIISTYLYPEHPAFVFPELYARLSDQGFVLYPGKLSERNAFRIGNIGQIYTADIERLLAALQHTLSEMGVPIPVPPAAAGV